MREPTPEIASRKRDARQGETDDRHVFESMVHGRCSCIQRIRAQQDSTPGASADDLPDEGSDGIGSPPYIAATHGDWEDAAAFGAEEGPAGTLPDVPAFFDGEQPAVEVTLFDVPDDETVVPAAQIVTPLNTLIAQPLRLQVG